MSTRTDETIVIVGAERLMNSRNGNPTWEIKFADTNVYGTFSGKTGRDAAVGYSVSNLLGEIRRQGPLECKVTWSQGRIDYIVPTNGTKI